MGGYSSPAFFATSSTCCTSDSVAIGMVSQALLLVTSGGEFTMESDFSDGIISFKLTRATVPVLFWAMGDLGLIGGDILSDETLSGDTLID